MPSVTPVARHPRPVFVDPTGRRGARSRHLTRCVAGLFLAFLGLTSWSVVERGDTPARWQPAPTATSTTVQP